MIDPPPEQVTWYYGQWQSAYENLDIPKLRLEEGLPKSFDTGKRHVVVLDDLMAETDGRVTQLFTKKSHHSNTSVIYLVQNLFPKHKESRTISLNAQYMVVFKNPRDASQVTHLAKQMYPGRVNFVQEAFKDAMNVPYGYLLVDLKQDTPEDLRLRTTRRRRSVRLRSETITNTGTCHARHSAEYADAELISALCECAHNILRGTVRLTPQEKVRLRRYRTDLHSIVNKKTAVARKRRILQQKGGFLPALLAPLASSVLLPLLRQLFA